MFSRKGLAKFLIYKLPVAVFDFPNGNAVQVLKFLLQRPFDLIFGDEVWHGDSRRLYIRVNPTLQNQSLCAAA